MTNLSSAMTACLNRGVNLTFEQAEALSPELRAQPGSQRQALWAAFQDRMSDEAERKRNELYALACFIKYPGATHEELWAAVDGNPSAEPLMRRRCESVGRRSSTKPRPAAAGRPRKA